MQKKRHKWKKKAISTYSRLKTVKKISKYKFRWSQLEQFPLSVCFLVAVFLFLFFLYFSFFGSLWITICNQPALSTLLSLPFISTFFCLCSNLPRCGVRSHDCLYSRRHHLEHAQLWLFTHPAWHHGRSPPPQRSSVSSLSLSSQIGCGVSTPWPTSSRKPIPPKRLKDKLNLMPCNKLSGLLCSGRHCASQQRNGTCVHFFFFFFYLYGNHKSTWSRIPTAHLEDVGVRQQVQNWDTSKTFAITADEFC